VGVDVDEAQCSVLLGRARLREGQPAVALNLLEAGLAGLARRPDNAPGLTEVHALLAEAQAGIGDSQSAAHHVAAASEQAQRCGSPALDAEVARAAGMVAARLGRSEEARERLQDALMGYEALGALPAAALVREELGRLER
jgi:tetratricopeptide (TPR) repeat protein